MNRDHDHPVSFDAKAFPTYKLAALADTLATESVPVAELLRGSSLTEAALFKPTTRVSYRQMKTVYANAMRLATQPGIGLRAGHRIRLTGTGLYGYALLSSPTVRDAVDFCMQYYRITGTTCLMDLSVADESVIWAFDPVLALDPSDDLYRFSVELHSSVVQNLFLDIFGPGFKLKQMNTNYADPGHPDLYRAIFDCPVHFDSGRNELVHDAGWLDHPLVYGDRITHAMMLEMCAELMHTLHAPHGVAGKVHQSLLLHPGRFVGIEGTAHELGMSVRTLRRRLDAEETNYQQIVSDVRCDLAIRYLRSTAMTHDEIADRLGYSDASSFRQAFKRWTGKQPGAYRGKREGA